MKPLQNKIKILDNLKVSDGYFKLRFSSSRIASGALPGQFVMLRVNDGTEPLLRRPLGIHRVQGRKAGIVELLYEVVGKGTEILSRKKPGEYVDIIGPLGNGFDYKSQSHKVPPKADQPAAGTKSPILVAGGMGVAPLAFLAEKIIGHQVTRLPGHQVIVLLGAKTKNQILCEKEFRKLGCEVKIATDDGSAGFKGRVTDLLKGILVASRKLQVAREKLNQPATCNLQPATVYACGPEPMLKAVSVLAKSQNIPAQLSLEAHMSCGFGACLGCVINTIGGYKRVCKEGPVFSANEIIWK